MCLRVEAPHAREEIVNNHQRRFLEDVAVVDVTVASVHCGMGESTIEMID